MANSWNIGHCLNFFDQVFSSSWNNNVNKPLEFLIIKIDNVRMNVIASRRVLLEETKNVSKDEVLAKFKVGDIVKGKIKAIQSYGAFVSVIFPPIIISM